MGITLLFCTQGWVSCTTTNNKIIVFSIIAATMEGKQNKEWDNSRGGRSLIRPSNPFDTHGGVEQRRWRPPPNGPKDVCSFQAEPRPLSTPDPPSLSKRIVLSLQEDDRISCGRLHAHCILLCSKHNTVSRPFLGFTLLLTWLHRFLIWGGTVHGELLCIWTLVSF